MMLHLHYACLLVSYGSINLRFFVSSEQGEFEAVARQAPRLRPIGVHAVATRIAVTMTTFPQLNSQKT